VVDAGEVSFLIPRRGSCSEGVAAPMIVNSRFIPKTMISIGIVVKLRWERMRRCECREAMGWCVVSIQVAKKKLENE
jgi:hypothetical protein